MHVLFFARYRELTGIDRLDITPPLPADLDALMTRLAETSPAVADVMQTPRRLTAVNQTLVRANCALHEGDEIAFFPPVTGG